jgi:hypothetical protein
MGALRRTPTATSGPIFPSRWNWEYGAQMALHLAALEVRRVSEVQSVAETSLLRPKMVTNDLPLPLPFPLQRQEKRGQPKDKSHLSFNAAQGRESYYSATGVGETHAAPKLDSHRIRHESVPFGPLHRNTSMYTNTSTKLQHREQAPKKEHACLSRRPVTHGSGMSNRKDELSDSGFSVLTSRKRWRCHHWRAETWNPREGGLPLPLHMCRPRAWCASAGVEACRLALSVGKPRLPSRRVCLYAALQACGIAGALGFVKAIGAWSRSKQSYVGDGMNFGPCY